MKRGIVRNAALVAVAALFTPALARAGVSYVSQTRDIQATVRSYQTPTETKSASSFADFDDSVTATVADRTPLPDEDPFPGLLGGTVTVSQQSHLGSDGITVHGNFSFATTGENDSVTFRTRVITTFDVDTPTDYDFSYDLASTFFPTLGTPIGSSDFWNHAEFSLTPDNESAVFDIVALDNVPEDTAHSVGQQQGTLAPGRYTFSFVFDVASDIAMSPDHDLSLTFSNSTPPAVPLPPAVWGGLTGLGMMVGATKRYCGKKRMTS